jgi:beta-lactam-binding protein with PASTA domain
VPNVAGATLATAENNITAAGLVAGAVTQQASGKVAAGDVISTTLAAATIVASGSTASTPESSG